MIQELPDISFERNMNHNYLILKKCDFFADERKENSDFRIRMLLENNIQGLVPVTHRMVNGESRYYYEINSLQALDRLYDKKEIKYNELKKLLMGCVKLFDRLEEYLLDGSQVIIKSEFIYINVETMEPYFICYPDYTGDVRVSFMEFIDELLTKIDHTDQNAVMLGYQVYRYIRNSNYVLSEIRNMMENVIVDMSQNINQSANPNTNEIVVHNAPESNKTDGVDKVCGVTGLSYIPEKSKHDDSSFMINNVYKETKSHDFYESDDLDESDTSFLTSKRGIFNLKGIGDLIGMILCVCIALSAAAIILGGRMLGQLALTGRQEMYLFGALAMAVVAALLFLYCLIKNHTDEKEVKALQEDEEWNYFDEVNKNKDVNRDTNKADNIIQNLKDNNREAYRENKASDNESYSYYYENYSNETVCLGSSVVEERMLRGKVNGKDINISLSQLPVTIGKLASFVDYAINDNAVSKLHARFEEHDGRVCLCDLNSTNGTVRNGSLIDINKPVVLEPGDKLRFGRSCFTYC